MTKKEERFEWPQSLRAAHACDVLARDIAKAEATLLGGVIGWDAWGKLSLSARRAYLKRARITLGVSECQAKGR